MWLALTLWLVSRGTQRPTVSVLPRFAVAPSAVRITARPNGSVRGWCLDISADDSAYYRASCSEAEGSVQPIYDMIPPGHYVVRYVVTYSTGVTRFAETSFCIGGESPC